MHNGKPATSSDFVSINKSSHTEKKRKVVLWLCETNLVTDNKLTRMVRNRGVLTVSPLDKHQEGKEEETPEETDECEKRKVVKEKKMTQLLSEPRGQHG